MGSRDTVSIEELRRKLEIVERYGRTGSGRGWVRRRLSPGTPPSTWRWWVAGSAGRAAGTVPAPVQQAFMTLLTDELPGKRSASTIADLLEGRAADLEIAFRSGSAVVWWEAIAREATRGRLRIVRDDALDGHLVEVVGATRPIESVLSLGELFRFECDLAFDAHVLLLQSAQRTWGAVPFADGSFERLMRRGIVHLPGIDGTGRLAWMREWRDPGHHRFVCLASRDPFPVTFLDALRSSGLDVASLDRLAAFYDGRSRSGRSMEVLDVWFES